MSTKPRVRIESNGKLDGTKVFLDGKDIGNMLTAVSWHLGVDSGPSTADLTFYDVQIEAEADLAPSARMPRFASDGDRERFLSMFGDRLDDYFTPEFAAFVRHSPQPVEPRERVPNQDEPYAPPADRKRTPEQWCAHYDVEIKDPDGWRSKGAPAWDEPITLVDFRQRAARSTCMNVVGEAWRQVGRDACALTDDQR